MSFLFNKDVNIKNPSSQFSEVLTISRSPVVELIPIKGLSELRNISNTSSGGSITLDGTEIQLSTGATANNYAKLYSAERGRYIVGYGGQQGIGIRFSNTIPSFTGTAKAEWGYYSGRDGALFGIDASNNYVKIIRDGVEVHKTYRSDWNLDKLDGSGPSGVNLEFNDGDIWQIDFTWYGYGDIVFNVVKTNPTTKVQEQIPLHYFEPTNQTSIKYPNLPIYGSIENGDQATNYDMHIGGRHFSIVGPYKPIYRITTEYIFNKGTDTTLRPLISIKSKNTEADLAISKKISGFDLVPATEDIFYQVRVNGTLSNTQPFQVPTDHANTETSIETDKSANTITGGHPIFAGIIGTSGGGTGQSEAKGSEDTSGLFLDIPEDQPCSLVVRTISGTGTISGVFRIREEF